MPGKPSVIDLGYPDCDKKGLMLYISLPAYLGVHVDELPILPALNGKYNEVYNTEPGRWFFQYYNFAEWVQSCCYVAETHPGPRTGRLRD